MTQSAIMRGRRLHLPDAPGIESFYNSDEKTGKIEKKTYFYKAMICPNRMMLFLHIKELVHSLINQRRCFWCIKLVCANSMNDN